MESAQIELVAQGFLRPLAQFHHLNLADLVGAGLPRHDDVPLDLADHALVGAGSVGFHVLDGLFTRPLFVVDAGIDHQPHSTEQLGVEIAQFAVGIILVHANLTRQLLGVERPAFHVRRERDHAPEDGQSLQRLGNGQLEVVTGNALVVRQGLHAELLDLVHVAQVGIKDAGTRPAQVAGHVIGPG